MSSHVAVKRKGTNSPGTDGGSIECRSLSYSYASRHKRLRAIVGVHAMRH